MTVFISFSCGSKSQPAVRIVSALHEAGTECGRNTGAKIPRSGMDSISSGATAATSRLEHQYRFVGETGSEIAASAGLRIDLPCQSAWRFDRRIISPELTPQTTQAAISVRQPYGGFSRSWGKIASLIEKEF